MEHLSGTKDSICVTDRYVKIWEIVISCFEWKCELLGSKTLGTNILELQFVLCWQTMIKTQSLGLGLFKVCLLEKLESRDCRNYWTKSARLDRSKIRLDRSNHVQIYFFAEIPIQPKPV